MSKSSPWKYFDRIEIEQGSPEWKELRLKHATASQIPALLGICPYSKRDDVLREKITGKEKEIGSFQEVLFARGHSAEKAGRECLEKHLGIELPPAVLRSKALPDLMASLDGFNEKAKLIFESKYMGKKKLELVKEGIIQPHHFAQIQAQLFVSCAEKAIYFATDNDGSSAFMYVEPDPVSFEKIILAVQHFMNDLNKEREALKESV